MVSGSSLAEWRTDEPDRWTANDGVLRFQTHEQPGGADTLLYALPVQNFDCHFDYRSDSNVACEIVVRADPITEAGEDELRIVIEWPCRGTGGVFDVSRDEWLAAIDPIAQRQLLPNRWNDIRLQVCGGHVRVHANGWLLVNVSIPRLRAGLRRFGLRGSDGRDAQQWRFLRLRTLTEMVTS